MRIVLDTNALISTLSEKLNYEIVLDCLLLEKYDLFITNEILLEYEEKVEFFFDKQVLENTLELLKLLSNIHKIATYYQLNLITSDSSDNKFVDCAFACNADYIVTDDKHFNILKTIDFPKLKTISIEQFAKLLKEK